MQFFTSLDAFYIGLTCDACADKGFSDLSTILTTNRVDISNKLVNLLQQAMQPQVQSDFVSGVTHDFSLVKQNANKYCNNIDPDAGQVDLTHTTAIVISFCIAIFIILMV